MTNPTLDALIKARGYVERGWTQGAYARTKSGRVIGPETRGAVCWCMGGALIRAGVFLESFDLFGPHVPYGDIAGWNDNLSRTQAEVLALFDRAIEAQSSKGGQ